MVDLLNMFQLNFAIYFFHHTQTIIDHNLILEFSNDVKTLPEYLARDSRTVCMHVLIQVLDRTHY
jgi:hypothetical protein